MIVKCDGIDGCGKTTLLDGLESYFREHVSVTRSVEYGTPHDKTDSRVSADFTLAELVSRIAKSEIYQVDDVERQLLWMVIARRHNRVVLPKLSESAELILVDRSTLGNITYGSVLCRCLNETFEKVLFDLETADIIFWLDTPPNVCFRRVLRRARSDIIERKGLPFLSQVAAAYREYSQRYPQVKRLDGSLPRARLVQQAVAHIQRHPRFRDRLERVVP